LPGASTAATTASAHLNQVCLALPKHFCQALALKKEKRNDKKQNKENKKET
jgi:hypothetical protein